jgi:hypothetical protein
MPNIQDEIQTSLKKYWPTLSDYATDNPDIKNAIEYLTDP